MLFCYAMTGPMQNTNRKKHVAGKTAIFSFLFH
jgi:hypothetical protein